MNQQGQKNHNARMPTNKALRICRMLCTSDLPYPYIAEYCEVTTDQVANIAMRKTWTHISEGLSFRPRAVTVRRQQ